MDLINRMGCINFNPTLRFSLDESLIAGIGAAMKGGFVSVKAIPLTGTSAPL
jgi:hypothetical protein